MLSPDVTDRLNEFAGLWHVSIRRIVETPSSLIAFGLRQGMPVVLKAVALASDEARVGDVAAAFNGEGMVRVYERAPGVALLEELVPGTPLSDLVARGEDDAATHILAGVVAALHAAHRPTEGFDTVEAWGRGFDRYTASADRQVPSVRVEDARERYARLAETQGPRRLLHGDLQHSNVLSDRARGWVAIDAKGVVGELEFEFGAALRNPVDRPDVFASRSAMERRVRCFEDHLKIDAARVLEWAYAQAVLSAIWIIEDEGALASNHPVLRFADALAPVLDARTRETGRPRARGEGPRGEFSGTPTVDRETGRFE